MSPPPSAGSLPQPTAPRLITAAHEAATRSWQATPYYEARYGVRGWHFTLSDSGWMTTLPPCGREQTLRQIRWVSRVLSCRGMPSWLTEQHIRILTRALRSHAPEREADWQLLDDARQPLVELRRAVLSDEAFQARAEDFAEQVGLGSRPLAIGSGRILLSAAADQHSGIRAAVSSTLPWFTDPTRFEARWCDAARALVRSVTG